MTDCVPKIGFLGNMNEPKNGLIFGLILCGYTKIRFRVQNPSLVIVLYLSWFKYSLNESITNVRRDVVDTSKNFIKNVKNKYAKAVFYSVSKGNI